MKTTLILGLAVIAQPFLVNQPIVDRPVEHTVEIKQFEDKQPLAKLELPSIRPSNVPKPQRRVSGGCEAIRAKLSALGVSGAELDAAIQLAMRESTCNEYAVNKSSGACGAYQSLPCGKWGATASTEYYKNAISYCKQRYGSFQSALAFQLKNGWY